MIRNLPWKPTGLRADRASETGRLTHLRIQPDGAGPGQLHHGVEVSFDAQETEMQQHRLMALLFAWPCPRTVDANQFWAVSYS